MSTRVYKVVKYGCFCTEPNCENVYHSIECFSKAHLMRDARSAGWAFIGNDRTLCPECLAKEGVEIK